MFARSKRLVLALAVLPVLGTLAVSTAGPTSAAANRQQTMSNGTFTKGKVGWYASTARTRVAIVQRGRSGTKAAQLSNRRAGSAVLNSRTTARSTKAGQRYTVSVWVRTTRARTSGRLVLRETVNNRAVKNTAKRFAANRRWHKVVMTATTRRSTSALSVRLVANRLNKRKALLVDDVSVLKWLPRDKASRPSYPPYEWPTDPTEPPGGRAGELSNGCAISARGIPANCAALLGSAYGGNTEPSPWEAEMGQQLGVRRTYWGASSVDKSVAVAKADLAKGRLPWVSYKLPYGWTDMANGRGDAWTRDLATKLSKLDGPVWLAFHHEPEGDGDITEWTRMQERLAPIVRANAGNVAYSIVLTGWHQLFGAKQYSLDSLWPKNTKIDLAGFDVYYKYGVVKDGKENTDKTDLTKAYWKPFNAWAKRQGVAWGVAETGFTDKAAREEPDWVYRTYNELRANGGIAFTYFNTNLNSVASWALIPDYKKQQFAAAMKGTPTL